MSHILKLQTIPPEIWNCILFFTQHQDLVLIRFLMFHHHTLQLSIDIPKIKEFFLRNTKPICVVLPPIDYMSSYRLIDYASLYPSSMISENIKAIEE